MIVELEAYHHTEAVAHSFGGVTDRNAVMFGPAGYAYIYRSYGLHWCVNFVCERAGSAAVLIRAVDPATGIALMRRRRGLAEKRLLCSGPGRLTQAMGVTRASLADFATKVTARTPARVRRRGGTLTQRVANATEPARM